MQENVLAAPEQKTGKGIRKARARKNFVFIPLIAVIAGAIAFSFASSSGVSLITGNSVSSITPFAWLAGIQPSILPFAGAWEFFCLS